MKQEDGPTIHDFGDVRETKANLISLVVQIP